MDTCRNAGAAGRWAGKTRTDEEPSCLNDSDKSSGLRFIGSTIDVLRLQLWIVGQAGEFLIVSGTLLIVFRHSSPLLHHA